MNKKTTDIYMGQNPIYESLKLNEGDNKNKGKSELENPMSFVMNTFFDILLNSKMENAKTVRGFQEIKNKIIGTNNYSAFKQYLLSILQSLGAMDATQKDAHKKNIQYITDILNKLDTELNNIKQFDAIKKTLISKFLENFEADLKEREVQMKKTNSNLYNDIIKKGLIVKEEKKVDSEYSDEELISKAFNKSKQSLDLATSFVGTIERDQYTEEFKDNSDIERYKTIAADLLKKAKNLQMLDRKKLNIIITSGGEYKRSDYIRNQADLINEIIRQNKEYEKIKNTILNKSTGTLGKPVIICPEGYVYDISKGICIASTETKTEDATTTKDATKDATKKTKECTFPISLGTKCSEVGKLQTKIMTILPSVKSYLTPKGGADNIYGKGTASASNIIFGYLNNNKDAEIVSELTKEMYDKIMALSSDDIELDKISDNKNHEMGIEDKILEREEIKKSPIISFDEFYSILEETYAFDTTDIVLNESKLLKDSCIKKALDAGKIIDCTAIATKKEEKDTIDTTEIPPLREEWAGLKYVNSGSYTVSMDESLFSAWAKEIGITAVTFLMPAGGLALKAGSSAAKSLLMKVTSKIGAKKLATKLATKLLNKKIKNKVLSKIAADELAKSAAEIAAKKSAASTADALSRVSKWFWLRYKKIPIPKRSAAGFMGGTFGAGFLDFISGRDAFVIQTIEGFIDPITVKSISKGLVNSIDGYVSDEDWTCISTILAVIKGAWTLDDSDKPVSVWGYLKELYQKKEGESLVSDIKSVSPKNGEVEGFPKLKSADPLSSVSDLDWDIAKAETIKFLDKLESNESNIRENIKKLPKKYIDSFINEDFAEYDDEGNIEGIDDDEKETKNKDSKDDKEII